MRWIIAAALASLGFLAPGRPDLDRARPIVEARLRRAGIRLADALNRSFDPAHRGFGR